MTPLKLLERIRDLLQGSVAKWELPAQLQRKPISFYLQSIPEGEFADDNFYPLICIELLAVTDEIEHSTAQVLLTLGTYHGEDSKGWQDHLNLAQKVRETLLTNTIVGEFALELPIDYGVCEQVMQNFDFSNLLLTYQIPYLQRKYF